MPLKQMHVLGDKFFGSLDLFHMTHLLSKLIQQNPKPFRIWECSCHTSLEDLQHPLQLRVIIQYAPI